jgi:hypothetical protein
VDRVAVSDAPRDAARRALAESLVAELGIDLTPKFVAATDRVLMRLWLHGYRVTLIPSELVEVCP